MNRLSQQSITTDGGRSDGERCWLKVIADDTGGALVESAITLTLLLTIIFAIMDCCRAIYFDHYVRFAAEEAARYAMVRGSTWNNTPCTSLTTESCTASSDNTKALVKSLTPIGNLNDIAVATTWTGKTPAGAQCSTNNVANSPGCVVQVQVSYNFNFVVPFLPRNTLLLSSTSAVAISQ